MSTQKPVIDVHAHIFAEDTMELLRKETPSVAPSLTEITEEGAHLEIAGVHQNPFPRGAWDLDRRLADMEKFGFDKQVLAVCPQTLMYDRETELTLTVSQIQNEQIAALTRSHPDKFFGLGTMPMQAPQVAADELRRCVRDLGMKGAMIGTNINGRNLDDPDLEPYWEAASETGAFILLHPMKVAGMDRLKDFYLRNFIGNPLDTTIAAATLIFGGVLDRHPDLKFCLSHAGGFTPFQFGRWIHGWAERKEAQVHLKVSPEASINKLLYDTITHHPDPLTFLVNSAGADRVMLGSDYPFDMGMYDAVEVIQDLDFGDDIKEKLLTGSAERALTTNV
ncbi:amidohydrolase family protein [Pelagibacterium montanilacus]|uniref:amidohydrolase family protein n=1 Tax=Pelagibacterium montanilacus TaxID=2185280 RepID=UPI000F8EBE59|nr:amidohydrolase family protein [Pelagibacterium montanilacus]